MWSITNSTIIQVIIIKLTPIHIQIKINFFNIFIQLVHLKTRFVTNIKTDERGVFKTKKILSGKKILQHSKQWEMLNSGDL